MKGGVDTVAVAYLKVELPKILQAMSEHLLLWPSRYKFV